PARRGRPARPARPGAKPAGAGKGGGAKGGAGRGRGRPPERESEGPAWKRRAEARADDDSKGKKAGWGGVARKGAGRLRDEGKSSGAAEAVREAAGREAWEPEVWIDEGAVRGEAAGAVGRGRSKSRRPEPSDEGAIETDPSLRRAVSAAKAERFEARLKD